MLREERVEGGGIAVAGHARNLYHRSTVHPARNLFPYPLQGRHAGGVCDDGSSHTHTHTRTHSHTHTLLYCLILPVLIF